VAKSILVSGASGYLGSKIALTLINNGHWVTGIDLVPSRNEELNQDPCYRLFLADLTESSTFSEEFRKVDVLIHCAGLVHKKSHDLSRENYLRVNYHGTKNLLSFLEKGVLSHIIFLSSVSVYGNRSDHIIPDENSETIPEDYYGESKLATEHALREFSCRNGTPFTILRLSPVYGKDFLLNLVKRIYLPKGVAFYKISSGNQLVSLCSAHNIVDVISQNIDNHLLFNQVFNIKDKSDYSINEIIEAFKEMFSEGFKPTIAVPRFLVKSALSCLEAVMPGKAASYQYQLSKIALNRIYSCAKAENYGLKLSWNLRDTLIR
jgi:nucleoside-diphosphate-sugar epimerase